MRRGLLVLVGAVIFIDTMLSAALEPLLPSLSHRFGLDKGQAGVLVGLYALGTVLGAAPGGLIAARRGPRAAILSGLALMTIAGTTFALASSIAVLDASRFVQGLGGACSWTACLAWLVQETPRERRGEVLGIGIGAGIFGAQLGQIGRAHV